MKLCIKRVYCPKCKKLTSCEEQKANDVLKIVCSRCGSPIWLKEGMKWKYAQREV